MLLVLVCGPRCQRLCLIQHNYYRALHDAPPLRCDPELAKSAQAWSNEQARRGGIQRSSFTGRYGENIAWKSWTWRGVSKMRMAIPSAVRSWYSELKTNNSNSNSVRSTGEIKHFESVVRTDEKRLGCGYRIRPGDGTYVTAHYGSSPVPKGQVLFHDQTAPITIRKRKPLGELVYTSQELHLIQL